MSLTCWDNHLDKACNKIEIVTVRSKSSGFARPFYSSCFGGTETPRHFIMTDKEPIIEAIGKDSFEWLLRKFSRETTLKDVPDEVLDRISSVDITVRNYASNRDAITSIAVITFAYKLANNPQKAQFGAKDILLLKVLAKNEKLRREGKGHPQNRIWDAPLFELITGEVGGRIRGMRTMNSPV
jgi:hypothetical protein